MKALYDLREKFEMELEEIAEKPDMSAGDLETVHKLTDTIKNIDKICMMAEGGHSHDGDWEAEMRGNYSRESSYRGGRHWVRGHYSRDGYANDGQSNRGYSRDSSYYHSGLGVSRGKDEMVNQIGEMMNRSSSDQERQALKRCMDELRNSQ